MSAQPAMMMSTRATETELLARYGELVKRIAHHLSARLPTSVDVNDLIQGGLIGLIEAARHYSDDKGASFETYAGIRIRGAMLDELRKSDWAPRSVHRLARSAAKAMHEIEQATGREARDAEVAEKLSVSLSEYHAISADAARCQILSMDAHAPDEEGFDYPDGSSSPMDQLQQSEFQHDLAENIGNLPEREKLVLSLYYEEEMNLREIGATLNISESRVCQIHGQALLRLKARMHEWQGEVAVP
ncbi:RNA polymerase sigma factor FliA [Stenotrophobium rhamnosiphilum]|uniref:RNA polymerase sigma factor FliA n=1 Tax=Stenotrophobium rhamnosiphilum TaxID=2029166 RepID=A0A2T5MD94_9GAMM|nr:RNA polymerase sigma factor FliA [Stenotrophobium rhamnosiphilum]PTU30550.1 RNA polymerase sigma factor FliA [Stenotrophobium rhamnosiphilum]